MPRPKGSKNIGPSKEELKKIVTGGIPVKIEDGGGIKPLPLFPKVEEKKEEGGQGEKPVGEQAPQDTMQIFEDRQLLEQGLAEIMEDSIPRLLKNGVTIFRLEDRVSIIFPSKARVALWSKFALPMLEKYFPNIKKEYFFLLLTASIFGSMVEVKKLPEKGDKNGKGTEVTKIEG